MWFKPSGEAVDHAPSRARAGGLQTSPDLRRSAASPDGSMALLDAQGFGVCCPRGSQVVISKSPGEKKPTGWWAVGGVKLVLHGGDHAVFKVDVLRASSAATINPLLVLAVTTYA